MTRDDWLRLLVWLLGELVRRLSEETERSRRRIDIPVR